jgi:hypothetical protein
MGSGRWQRSSASTIAKAGPGRMTLPNSSPALGENIKSGFARLAENLRAIDDPDACVLRQRCEEIADGVPPRNDEAERRRQKNYEHVARMDWERRCLLSVLFKPLPQRQAEFNRLCEHSDVPQLYIDDYERAFGGEAESA